MLEIKKFAEIGLESFFQNGRFINISGSVEDSAEKVEGPGTRGTSESANDSKEGEGPEVASTLSGLLAGLPTFAGSQRIATTLRQKFAENSGEYLFPSYRSTVFRHEYAEQKNYKLS